MLSCFVGRVLFCPFSGGGGRGAFMEGAAFEGPGTH